MSAVLLAAPAAEPISLSEAKAYLRVETDDDDDLIAALIRGARGSVEAATRRALINQTWRLSLDDWPATGRIAVSPSPLRGVTAACVYDAAGAAHTVDPQAFVCDTAGGVLAFAPWAMPAPGRAVAGIAIDIVTGYGATPDLVPEPLRQAVRLLLAHAYENRGVAAIGHEVASFPHGVAALMAPYRVVSL